MFFIIKFEHSFKAIKQNKAQQKIEIKQKNQKIRTIEVLEKTR